ELGKNHKALKEFDEAEQNLTKALEEKPDDAGIKEELFAVYYELNDWNKASVMLEQLAKQDNKYLEDQAEVYCLNQDYQKALKALDKAEVKTGFSESLDDLRHKIYKAADEHIVEGYLNDQIDKHPGNVQHYGDLLALYVQSDAYKKKHRKKADELVGELLGLNIDDPEIEVELYQFYLKEDEVSKAKAHIKAVLEHSALAHKTKAKVLKDVANFVVQNPEYEDDFAAVLNNDETEEHPSHKASGIHYSGADNKKAIEHFKKYLD